MNHENMLYYPLNGYEMAKLNPNAKIITYNKLNNIHSPQELFKNCSCVIILYLLKSRFSGHWVVCLENEDGYYFFDSYGKHPDAQIDKLTHEERKEYNQKQKRLENIFKNYIINYNNVPLQGKGTQVCGCYVSHRLQYPHLTNKEYRNELFKYGNDTDFTVANICLERLNNLKKISR